MTRPSEPLNSEHPRLASVRSSTPGTDRVVVSASASNVPRSGAARAVWCALVFAMVLAPAPGSLSYGQPDAGRASLPRWFQCEDGVRQDVCQRVADVAVRLVRSAEAPQGYAWPPHVILTHSARINAFSWSGPHATYLRLCTERLSAEPVHDNPELRSTVAIVTEAVATEIAEVDADRLSLILGHELAHLTLEHSLLRKGRRGEFSEVLESVNARDEEFAADRLGVTIALRAGFSYEAIVATFQRYLDRGANVYDAVHALGSNHPSWKERLAKIDEGQSALWSSMSAFDSGVLFLLVEQYAAAERAFRAVVGDFPNASEAWANLGYALLMQYCDALDPGDLAMLGVGHVLVGGFYRRPATLEARVRGIDRKLWTAATIALSQALKLEPGLTLARANLGVAYLVGPDPAMATEGWRLLAAAADSAEMDPMLEPSMRMSILVNASVAGQSAGDTTAASAHLERVSELGQAFGPRGELPTPVSAAVIFNEARILERRPGRESEAMNLYRTYLKKASPSSVWWELAYDRYVTLSQALSIEPTPVETLRSTNEPAFRPVTSVELPAGEGISLSESVATVESRLGDAARIPVTPGGEVVRLSYPDRGLEILASDYVIGITQVGNVAPGLSLRPVGLGSATLGSLAPGMSVKEVDALLASVPFERREIVEKGVLYRFYRPLGVAVRVKEDRVTEVVVVHIPESG